MAPLRRLALVVLVAVSAPLFAEESYPRLLFTADEIPALKYKVKESENQVIFARAVKVARKALQINFADSNLQENRKDTAAAYLAFAALITDGPQREKFAAKAREALLNLNNGPYRRDKKRFASRFTWDNQSDVIPWVPGRMLMNYALAYDWLVGTDLLKGSERDRAASRIKILLQQEWQRLKMVHGEAPKGFTPRGVNKRMVSLSGVGMAALLFPDQRGTVEDPDGLLNERSVTLDTARRASAAARNRSRAAGSMARHASVGTMRRPIRSNRVMPRSRSSRSTE
jgi:hypothetical protein